MIDIIFFIILFLAMVQGWRKGLIIGLLSMICGLIGLAAAVKFSAILAAHMESDIHLSNRWLPVISFILVFVLVVLLIQWIGRLLEKLVKLVLLDWLNKLGGILLFVIFYVSIYSILLFYGARTPFISKQAVSDSHFYSLIAPFGPAIIRFITGFFPFGQDMFAALEGFFDKVARNIH